MRGRDHDAEISAHRAGHHRYTRCRQWAEQAHIHADRGKASHEGRFDHVTRQARILADDDQVAAIGFRHEHLAGGHADPVGDLGGHREGIGLTADAVGAEIFAGLGHGGHVGGHFFVTVADRVIAVKRHGLTVIGDLLRKQGDKGGFELVDRFRARRLGRAVHGAENAALGDRSGLGHVFDRDAGRIDRALQLFPLVFAHIRLPYRGPDAS